mmetsp:Transcript_16094/g.39743  ORF Transcript_16094/g.39743 Transcript_16094/m.39743 type:complete len:204 (-) Transcript_16094:172-783(-)
MRLKRATMFLTLLATKRCPTRNWSFRSTRERASSTMSPFSSSCCPSRCCRKGTTSSTLTSTSAFTAILPRSSTPTRRTWSPFPTKASPKNRPTPSSALASSSRAHPRGPSRYSSTCYARVSTPLARSKTKRCGTRCSAPAAAWAATSACSRSTRAKCTCTCWTERSTRRCPSSARPSPWRCTLTSCTAGSKSGGSCTSRRAGS